MWSKSVLDAAQEVARTTNLQGRVRHLDDPKAKHGGRRNIAPDMIVWHATEGDTVSEAISWLDRILKTGESPASYHYGIDADGRIVRIVHPDLVAWHAGRSSWPGKDPDHLARWESVNRRSVGVAFAILEGLGHDLTQAQLESGLWLAKVLMANYRTIHLNVMHAEVAPLRKTDLLSSTLPSFYWRVAINTLTGR